MSPITHAAEVNPLILEHLLKNGAPTCERPPVIVAANLPTEDHLQEAPKHEADIRRKKGEGRQACRKPIRTASLATELLVLAGGWGSAKAPTTGVRDHRDPNNDASPQGGVRITGEKPRPPPLCAGWGC
jgi:hypothetical protein